MILRIQANDDTDLAALRVALDELLSGYTTATVTKLVGTSATVDAANTRYDSKGPFSLIVGFGHGDRNNFFGQADAPVFSTTSHPRVITNAIVYLVSCYCGLGLGSFLVRVMPGMPSSRAFIGYTSPFALPYTSGCEDDFLAETQAIVSAIANSGTSATTRTAATTAYNAARTRLQNAIPSGAARAEDVSRLDKNHGGLVGPWTREGSYGKF